jgi:hypothetical protein
LGICEWKKCNISLIYLDLERIRGGKIAFHELSPFSALSVSNWLKIGQLATLLLKRTSFSFPSPLSPSIKSGFPFPRHLPLFYTVSFSFGLYTYSYLQYLVFKSSAVILQNSRYATMVYCCKINCEHCKFV